MRKISADTIYTSCSSPISKGVIIVDDSGKILEVLKSREGISDIEIYEGIITPGFVNTHCHLELSHLKSKLNEGKGLPSFIKEVQKYRNSTIEEIQNAIVEAENEMIKNGIVAVGDISNSKDSFFQKQKNRLYYHTFVEVFGYAPEVAEKNFNYSYGIFEQAQKEGLECSLVPHAPYSVSNNLNKLIQNVSQNQLGTIHNQETISENEMFLLGEGELYELMKWFNPNSKHWGKSGKTSLQTQFPYIENYQKMLFVHNTFISQADFDFLNKKIVSEFAFFCLCPNANWFIESKLPNIYLIQKNTENITLGTDSLASNWSLCIWDEIQRIRKHFPEIELSELIKWGTINGAKFLGIEEAFGAIQKNKTPGLVNISKENKVKKIV